MLILKIISQFMTEFHDVPKNFSYNTLILRSPLIWKKHLFDLRLVGSANYRIYVIYGFNLA